jgi:hypothetical protein
VVVKWELPNIFSGLSAPRGNTGEHVWGELLRDDRVTD